MVLSASSEAVAFAPLETAGPLAVWLITLSFVFFECAFIFGLFLPGDSLLFAAGVVLAQHDGELSAWLLSIAAMIVAVVGNQIGYYIGRHTGTRLLARRGGKVLNKENLAKARDFLDRRGFWAIVLARWIPWVRTLAPMIAGAARMDPRRFMLATTIGALAWVPTLVLAGYYGAGLLTSIPWLQTAAVILSVAFFVFGTAYGLYRYRQEMRKPLEEEVGSAPGNQ
ncbi:membrane-associated protein [Saccharothrix tamanrassetensis]|uniref:Membrane-associated protein n=1 Tax=Saccharothrix tamanrassetensis TaxID=1051531 RepID=A0A841C7L9_9PSEU|nr:DedA family protein [Saccharothrix tamanrassetensis]MBB5954492.1 membrane-associated protein [Saccharothrix tamanrassetensis]